MENKFLTESVGGSVMKSKKNRIYLISAVVVILVAMILTFSACKGGKGSAGVELTGDPASYSVTVKTVGGMAMSEIDVYIYLDDTLEDMHDYAKTDENGTVTFNMPEYDNYAIVLSGVKKGYDVAASYKFDDKNAVIELTSSLITDEDISTAKLDVGSVMYDFTLMKPDETEITLSEVLKEKDMVLLNFWYTTCSWCVEEFPIMNEVYEEYKDRIEIIAVDPMDDTNAVKTFQAQYGLNFPMAACSASWANVFPIEGYPTSVIIDRYGVICLIESGAITSKTPFISTFEHFTGDDYEQKLFMGGVSDLVTRIKPTVEMASSEEIAAIINQGDINVTYRPETDEDSAEYSWPFIEGEKLGQSCVYASNIDIDDSFAIMYCDVELKAGQALGLDFLASSEQGCDVLYVIVDDEDVFQISGVSETEQWQSCYPVVAEKDGTYEVALCYLKDSDGAEGEDTVYIDNMRIVDVSAIDVDTYLPRNAAVTEDGENYEYATVVYNESDGYYHVGTANGPLLLADLMNYTQFSEEETLQEIVTSGSADKDGISLYNKVEEGGAGMVKYFSYASNSTLNGVCTVNKELAEMLKQVADIAGFSEDENEWLKICKYFKAYGKGTAQLEDPIKGLAPFCAYKTTLGKNVPTNYFYYNRAIIPRGLFSEFIPAQSGVYRFTSKSDYKDGIDAWVFDENGVNIYTYEHEERLYTDDINCSMVYYMEAGKPYYINMAFWDIYATGYIYYDVEYLGASVNLFRTCAPGYFTYDSDATGSQIYDIISGGIEPVLKNGKYYESEDNSLIYADFTYPTRVFGHSIVEMIDLGGFDFSKSETDGEILAYLKQNDNDPEKTREYLKKLWGEDYDANADIYELEDVLNGIYHGSGPDLTEEIRAYVNKVDKSGKAELEGCVVVDERLAEILQLLMNKYTFEDVENSWIKLCYYYDYLGPAK
ncbi:MAG: redoxin domain-containing protein [Clostridia bacterium]|nr:redoxin domain-containing protein [Clostridia bacterium]